MDDPKGWHRLFDFMLSGEPGSLALWGILAYGVWATIYGRSDTGGDAGYSGSGRADTCDDGDADGGD